jgi:hypothetical protein
MNTTKNKNVKIQLNWNGRFNIPACASIIIIRKKLNKIGIGVLHIVVHRIILHLLQGRGCMGFSDM